MSNSPTKAPPGGSASKQHDYFGSIAGIICQGRLDFIWGLMLDGKLVWPTTTIVDGNQPWPGTTFPAGTIIAYQGLVWETPTVATAAEPPSAPWIRFRRNRVDVATNPYKFSVPSWGDAFLYWGTADQVLDAVDEKFLTDNGHPSYRHRAVLALKDFLFGTERQSAPNAVVLGGRAPMQSVIVGDAVALDLDWQANPWCVLVELLTHPVIGLGFSNSVLDATSWQAMADKCLAQSPLLYISPIYDRQQSVRSLVADILQYVDGFTYWTADGKIAAGMWPHGQAAPEFSDAITIDMHDLIEPIKWTADTWRDTANATTVNYNDINYAFNSVPATASNLYNRIITRRVQTRSLDRPHIVRSLQAMAMATEDAKLNGEPKFSGELPVRQEKAVAINPGDIFLVTDDAQQITRASRCLSKTYSAPPVGSAKLKYETESGLAELPYHATPLNPTPAAAPRPARIANFQFLQVPPQLSLIDADHQLVCLIARSNAVTTSVGVWWKNLDTETFEQLATQSGFAVLGTVAAGVNTQTVTVEDITNGDGSALDTVYSLPDQNIWNVTVRDTSVDYVGAEGVDYVLDPIAGKITVIDNTHFSDGDTISVSYARSMAIETAVETPLQDFEKVSVSLTADEIANNTILMFVFKSSDPKQFEILSVKSVTAAGAGIYNIGVVRALYGTKEGGDGVYQFTTDDRAFLIYRTGLTLFTHQSFSTIAASAGTATFRLTPASGWVQADVEDVYNSLTNTRGLTTEAAYSFADPYPPAATWSGIFALVAGVWTDITDFTTVYDPGTKFRLIANMTDLNGDLTAYTLSYSNGGNTGAIIAADQLQPTGMVSKTFEFVLADPGQYSFVLSVKDRTGRATNQFLTAVGGTTEVTLLTQAAVATKTLAPTASYSIYYTGNTNRKIYINSASPAPTLKYQITAKGSAPGGSWITAANNLPTGFGPIIYNTATQIVYAYAQSGGLTDSDVVVFN